MSKRFIGPVFAEFQEALKKSDMKSARKLKQELHNIIRKNPNYPPFDRAADMLYDSSEGNEEAAVTAAFNLRELPDLYSEVAQSVIHTLTNFNYTEELIDYLSYVHKKFPTDIPTTESLFIQMFVNSRFSQAQVVAMELYRLKKSLNHSLFAAAAAFCRAKNINSSLSGNSANDLSASDAGISENDKKQRDLFFNFTIVLAKNVMKEIGQTQSADSIHLVAEALIELGKIEEAIEFLNQNKESVIMADEILFYRLMMKCLQKTSPNGEKNKEICDIALKFIDEVCSDSIDEWKIIVDLHDDPDGVIEKYIDKYRGAFLAKIELAKKRGQNDSLIELLLEYSDKYANRGFVLDDLRPYLADPLVLSSLAQSSKDLAVRSYTSNKFDGEVTDEKSAAIFGQYCMLKFGQTNDRSQLVQAASQLIKFNSQENHALLIRISGILEMTAIQMETVNLLNISNIQYLSLGPMFLPDFLNSWDLSGLTEISKKVTDFVRISLSVVSQFTQNGFNRYNFFVSFGAPQMKRDIERNEVGYFCELFTLLLRAITERDSINDFTFKKIIPFEFVDNYVAKIDESIVPMYFRDDDIEAKNSLHEIMFPSFHQFLVQVCAAVNIIYILKLQKEKAPQSCENLAKLGNGWQIVAEFAKSGKTALEPENQDFDLIQILTLAAIAIIKREGKAEVAALVEKMALKVIERIKIAEFPAEWKEKVEEQEAKVKNAADLIKDSLRK